MANQADLERLKQGVQTWNQWRQADPGRVPDLSGADLIGSDLGKINLRGANLTWARLGGARLDGADLRSATLIGADLSDVDLRRANLQRTNLSEVDLIEADLGGTIFRGTNVSGANLRGARVGHTIFGDVNLRVAQGLETVNHVGPSTLGMDTFYRSQGKLPERFLRGAGIPPSFIAS